MSSSRTVSRATRPVSRMAAARLASAIKGALRATGLRLVKAEGCGLPPGVSEELALARRFLSQGQLADLADLVRASGADDMSMVKCRCGAPLCNQHRLSGQGSVGFDEPHAWAIVTAFNLARRML